MTETPQGSGKIAVVGSGYMGGGIAQVLALGVARVVTDLVEAGKLGTKTGASFLNVPAERTPELIAYRDKAYVAMQMLLEDPGPAPIS